MQVQKTDRMSFSVFWSRVILPVTFLQSTDTNNRKRSNWHPDINQIIFNWPPAEVNLNVYSPCVWQTYIYNFDPLKSHFYIVGFTRVHIIFLISAQKHWMWAFVRTASARQDEAVLTSTHNLCFEHKYENYQNFYLKTFRFWWWNFQYIWTGVFS